MGGRAGEDPEGLGAPGLLPQPFGEALEGPQPLLELVEGAVVPGIVGGSDEGIRGLRAVGGGEPGRGGALGEEAGAGAGGGAGNSGRQTQTRGGGRLGAIHATYYAGAREPGRPGAGGATPTCPGFDDHHP